jgi:hypothetical protein
VDAIPLLLSAQSLGMSFDSLTPGINNNICPRIYWSWSAVRKDPRSSPFVIGIRKMSISPVNKFDPNKAENHEDVTHAKICPPSVVS